MGECEASWSGIAISARERSSAKRLEVAWQERDAMLDGEEAMTGNGKTYACKQCGETFDNHYKLAGHVSNQHRLHGRKALRAPKAKANGRVPCPMCCQALPAEVGVLARQLEGEGLDDEKALRAAVICWAGLRVP